MKPKWNKDNEYYEFHKIKGYLTNRCMKLNNYIQDLINRGDIELEGAVSTSKNKHLGIYKDPFPKHDKIHPQKNKGQNHQTNNIHYKKSSFL